MAQTTIVLSTASIGKDSTQTPVRGGGLGARAWVAKLTGTDRRYGFAREFVKKDTSDLSGSGKSGVIRFDVTEPGVYEFRDFCLSTGKNWSWSGFFRINEDGTVEQLDAAGAKRALAELAAA